jgi:putative ABC transport system ATP-binding protein
MSVLEAKNPSEAAAARPPALLVRDLQKGYALGESRVEVLHGVSLTLESGELAAIMGPSGVGKSTLLACIAGIEPADRGSIEIAGQSLKGLSDDGRALLRRRHVGVVYQFFNLIGNLTVRENVGIPYLIDGQYPDDAAVTAILERVGMKRRERHLPSELSGGEMQLVSIARALVRKPALVLADEPTGNVNVETGRRVMTLLREVVRDAGAAMLLVTHHPEDAAKADRVLFLKDGRLEPDAELSGNAVSVESVHRNLAGLGI